MKNHLLAAAIIVLAGAPAFAQAADKPAPASAAQTADVPSDVKTYVTTAPSDAMPYAGQVTIGRSIDGDQIWHQIPASPAYRWTNLNGQKVVVDKKSGHVVAVY
jgi:hypothetical protein